MAEVKVIKKKPTTLAVVAKQRKSNRWDAWIDSDPKIRAGGRNAMAAVGNLIRLNPEKFGVVIQSIALQPDRNPHIQSEVLGKNE